ncbi:AMP-binding protein [Veronia pacifica]|uniref:AMP-dependent synthetase n=1 Tax=Veronia pacifica TaxID=1080227 RepID=A0A1C3EDJ0_9GAMM|nr:AMP-binding protein [Veronia pacifica]ODA31317.1 AMP-dependent synthetase [Veronia pacifica]
MSLPKPYERMLQFAENERSNEVFLRQIINRQFKDFTYSDVIDQALRMVTALKAMGLQPGDRVALISKNCAEWFISDLAMTLGSFISVPIFPTAGKETIGHVLDHSESKALFIGKLDDTLAVKESIDERSEILTIAFPYPTINCGYDWNDLLVKHEPSDDRPEHGDDDLMTIVYTSGSTGLPKGAMLTYGAVTWAATQVCELLGVYKNDRAFSYLPLAHITERVYILSTTMLAGTCTAFPESLDTFIDDVKMHRPTLFISVPRLWTLFQQRIQEKLPDAKLNFLLKLPIISGLIKKKIQTNLGLENCRVLGCGSAPVSPALLRWYEKIGMNITEAWGMTESMAYSTVNYPYRSDKVGTVGNAGPGVEVKIADDGEILVKTKGLFSGYYKNEEATNETIIDGWLHTGDKGSLDADGYLSIEGRKKDAFKTAKGKFVSPVPIEKRLFELSNIELMCLVGSGMPAPILLAVPHQFPNMDKARYERKVESIISTINGELESHEKIKGVLMVEDPWSIENGILTPTLKIKRHELEKIYQNICDEWPKGKLVVWESN